MNYWLINVKLETGFIKKGDWVESTQTDIFAIHIIDGKVKEIVPIRDFSETDTNIIDCQNYLLLPGLVEKHCHLDKSKLGTPFTPIAPANNLVERFESEIPILDGLNKTVVERAEELFNMEVNHGVLSFRSHIDIEPATDLRYFNAIDSFRKEQAIPIELVAFPQHGLLRSKSSSLMEKALQSGADFVGGVDPYSLDGDYKASLAETFRLATTYDVGIDIHLHDRQDAGRKTIEEIIRLTKELHMQDKVFISHAFGLNDFTGDDRQRIFNDLANEKIHIITSVPITPNTIPPIDELIAHGVTVHLGCDNINDCWSPYGDGSIQEKLVRLGELYNVSSQDELSSLLGLITNGITPLNKKGEMVWPNIGADATYILTDANSSAEFVARKPPVLSSFYQGTQIK